jgi:hypothetical protein
MRASHSRANTTKKIYLCATACDVSAAKNTTIKALAFICARTSSTGRGNSTSEMRWRKAEAGCFLKRFIAKNGEKEIRFSKGSGRLKMMSRRGMRRHRTCLLCYFCAWEWTAAPRDRSRTRAREHSDRPNQTAARSCNPFHGCCTLQKSQVRKDDHHSTTQPSAMRHRPANNPCIQTVDVTGVTLENLHIHEEK